MVSIREASEVHQWTQLRVQTIEYEEVKELAKQVDPQMAIKDELFDEVLALNDLLKNIPDDEFYNNKVEPSG